ncbi:MAG: prephenate dehydrogenase/arogenate dehydrogenase family protein [Candidatus Nitrosocaldaceae archaeon]
MKIAIIGTGKMGSLFARYFKEKYCVYVYDKYGTNVEKLVKEGVKEITLEELKEIDYVILSVSLENMIDTLKEVVCYMKRGSILIEISSIKHSIYKIMKELYKEYGVRMISLHPLFGQGIKSMNDAKFVLVPVVNYEEEEKTVSSLFPNAKIIKMDAKEHDKAMAIILGLTHLVNFIFVKSIIDEDYNKLKEIGGTTFKLNSILLESIMNDAPNLTIQLLTLNPFMKMYTKKFMRHAINISRLLTDGDKDRLLEEYKEAREEMNKKSKMEESYELMYKILQELNNR